MLEISISSCLKYYNVWFVITYKLVNRLLLQEQMNKNQMLKLINAIDTVYYFNILVFNNLLIINIQKTA